MDGCLVEWGSHASWTCLPNGRVSGRFSDFRHNSRHSNPVSATEVSVSQETGFWVQRQRPPISSEPGTLRLQRLHRRHTARQFGAICTSPGNLRNRRNAWWRTQSGSNPSQHSNFLTIREIIREFRGFRWLGTKFCGHSGREFSSLQTKFPAQRSRVFFESSREFFSLEWLQMHLVPKPRLAAGPSLQQPLEGLENQAR